LSLRPHFRPTSEGGQSGNRDGSGRVRNVTGWTGSGQKKSYEYKSGPDNIHVKVMHIQYNAFIA